MGDAARHMKGQRQGGNAATVVAVSGGSGLVWPVLDPTFHTTSLPGAITSSDHFGAITSSDYFGGV